MSGKGNLVLPFGPFLGLVFGSLGTGSHLVLFLGPLARGRTLSCFWVPWHRVAPCLVFGSPVRTYFGCHLVLLFCPLSAGTGLHDHDGSYGLHDHRADGAARVRFSGPLQTLYNCSWGPGFRPSSTTSAFTLFPSTTQTWKTIWIGRQSGTSWPTTRYGTDTSNEIELRQTLLDRKSVV